MSNSRQVIVPPPPIDSIPAQKTDYKSTVDPLEIVLGAAQACWKAAQRDGKVDLEIATRAAMIAKEALPYMHVRKSASDTGDVSQEARASMERAQAQAFRNKIEDMARKVKLAVVVDA